MMAWVWPLSIVRSTPRRISFGPASVSTDTCRSRISRLLISWVFLRVRSSSGQCWQGASSGALGRELLGHGQFALDGGHEPLGDRRDADAVDQRREEPANHEFAGQFGRDPARLKVEQLLVVE